MKLWDKIRKFWYFHVVNSTVRTGEGGGFKWRFRRFWLEIETLSGNFKGRWTASENPYGYLMAGDDSQVQGFAERLYLLGSLLTTDQKLVNDVDKALKSYEKRMSKPQKGDPEEEAEAMAEMQQLQQVVDMPKKERRKLEKDIDKRLKKVEDEVKGSKKG